MWVVVWQQQQQQQLVDRRRDGDYTRGRGPHASDVLMPVPPVLVVQTPTPVFMPSVSLMTRVKRPLVALLILTLCCCLPMPVIHICAVHQGDPSAAPYAVDNARAILGKKPVFGICMGHQILGQAFGGKTFKLKFGHHGGNHPIRYNPTGEHLD